MRNIFRKIIQCWNDLVEKGAPAQGNTFLIDHWLLLKESIFFPGHFLWNTNIILTGSCVFQKTVVSIKNIMHHKTHIWVCSWMFTLVLVLWLVKKDMPTFRNRSSTERRNFFLKTKVVFSKNSRMACVFPGSVVIIWIHFSEFFHWSQWEIFWKRHPNGHRHCFTLMGCFISQVVSSHGMAHSRSFCDNEYTSITYQSQVSCFLYTKLQQGNLGWLEKNIW